MQGARRDRCEPHGKRRQGRTSEAQRTGAPVGLMICYWLDAAGLRVRKLLGQLAYS